jgi:SAM-dependent methyltransferase
MTSRRTYGRVNLFQESEWCLQSTSYQPLPSIWDGTDAELLEKMLDFYPRKRPKRILDATVNTGRFWLGNQRDIIGLDINPKFRPHVVADNRRMPFKDRCFDVVVYDPPHIPNQGRDKSKDFNTRFGLVLKSSAGNGYNFTHLYPPFVREAYRVQFRPRLQKHRYGKERFTAQPCSRQHRKAGH